MKSMINLTRRFTASQKKFSCVSTVLCTVKKLPLQLAVARPHISSSNLIVKNFTSVFSTKTHISQDKKNKDEKNQNRKNKALLTGITLTAVALSFAEIYLKYLDEPTYEWIQEDDFDLLKTPVPDMTHPLRGDAEVTIGDLHANALKLINFLVRQNALALAEGDYQRFVIIYKKSATIPTSLTEKDITDFKEILKNAKVNKSATVRLVGDELADRGGNDYLVLKIIEKLNNQLLLRIILSNHGAEFISAYENGFKVYATYMGVEYSRSIYGLGELVKNGLVAQQEVDDLITQHYFPNLKLLDYTLDNSHRRIGLYAHASIGPENMKAMAKELNVEYKAKTAIELANTIDQMNEAFSKIVKRKQVMAFTKLKYYGAIRVNPTCANPDKFSVMRALWNRRAGNNENIDPPVHKMNPLNPFMTFFCLLRPWS